MSWASQFIHRNGALVKAVTGKIPLVGGIISSRVQMSPDRDAREPNAAFNAAEAERFRESAARAVTRLGYGAADLLAPPGTRYVPGAGFVDTNKALVIGAGAIFLLLFIFLMARK